VRPNDNCIAPMTGANWLKLEQEVKSEAVQNLSVTRAAAEVQCNLARKLHNQATYKTKALQVIQERQQSQIKNNKLQDTSDVVETITSETETWLKFRDETETLS